MPFSISSSSGMDSLLSDNIPQEKSYGVACVFQGGDEDMLLLVRSKTHWGLPKGHPEGNESPIETARRELQEECGIIDIQFFPEHVFFEEYVFEHQGVTTHKTNTFFLAVVDDTALVPQENEIEECAFMSFDRARETVTYEGLRPVVDQIRDTVARMSKV